MKFDRWSCGIGLIFLYTFGAGALFLYAAINSDRGRVTDNAYSDSLKFQKTIERLQRSKALGWQVQFKSYNNTLTIQLTDKMDKPLIGAELSLSAMSAQKKGLQIKASDFTEHSSGSYQLNRRFAEKGFWISELEAQLADDKFLWRGNILIE